MAKDKARAKGGTKKEASSSTYRHRRSFAKIPDVIDVPNLIAIQKESFEHFIKEGIHDVFKEYSIISNKIKEADTETMILEITGCKLGEAKASVEECKLNDETYSANLSCTIRLVDMITGEAHDEHSVNLGDFPMMTPNGTFVVKGIERVVISQLVRSPGIFFSTERDKNSDKMLYKAKFIPARGVWLEMITDKRDILSVRIDKKRKQPATMLLRALDIATTNEEIIKLLGDREIVHATLEKDPTTNREEAIAEIYKRLNPGEGFNLEIAEKRITNLFFSPSHYDIADVGRYKINEKLGFGEEIQDSALTKDDIGLAMRYVVCLASGDEGYEIDDVDHFGNRRIRTVGELVQNQLRIGLSRAHRATAERMRSKNFKEVDQTKILSGNAVSAVIKEFFGSSKLTHYMDQANPAAGITQKRRLSALGPGGLSRERAGFEVRDVHTSHYGRMCPIETPEGQNIGLNGSLASFARVNKFGFIETPYRRVIDGKVTDEIDYLTADKEEDFIIAQANDTFHPETREFGSFDKDGNFTPDVKVLCRTRDAVGAFGEPEEVLVENVNYMDVSPRQMVSVATSLIPFIEHDDANRALMGSNMQRQAVPLLCPTAPLVGTGIEHRIIVDSGETLIAEHSGTVSFVDSNVIIIARDDNSGEEDEYIVPKFKHSNQNGCINHRPIVSMGDQVYAGDVLADGPSCDKAELALGQNLLVAYMPWEGYNYEDAIIISERVVAEDLLTSVHIFKYEIEARASKSGDEAITREIPNVSESTVRNLDENGIIRVGSEVSPKDILVGKVTPKGDIDTSPEEQLLLAIFGDKARDVRDTSLRMPSGSRGRVIDVVHTERGGRTKLTPGVNERVRVYVAEKRKIQQGDKLSGRHGNKGVISKVLPVEDMPYLADGTPIDVILNPLGVPSRMNVGQLLECHLGWAAKWGWSDDPNATKAVEGPMHVSTPIFDGATETEISDAIEAANRNLILKNREKYGDLAKDELVPQLSRAGKTTLYDGRTGEQFREPVTVGQSYILKLGHMVDDKLHARATGPYSLITQQPLGGKAQLGGQRFGEMEVWALYAHGASNVLREILTTKSDDTQGRVKSYEAITRGSIPPELGVPESFRVLLKEMRAIGLNVELLGENDQVVGGEDTEAKDEVSLELLEKLKAKEGHETLSMSEDSLEDFAADIHDLMLDDQVDQEASADLLNGIQGLASDNSDNGEAATSNDGANELIGGEEDILDNEDDLLDEGDAE